MFDERLHNVLAGVSVYIVRDYQLRGLLRPVACTMGGHGLFDDAAFQRLCFVRAAFEAGIGLDALARLCRALGAADGDQAIAQLGVLRQLVERRHEALAAEYLEIDLTESVAFGDPTMFPALEALRRIGVRFAADDFGTGYSCLQHLKCCPITTLKIDQSFIAGLANDHRGQTIVHNVIQLAHVLGMEVVAEGAETSASLDLLRQVDCDSGQGFLFAKPMPVTTFVAFVKQWTKTAMNVDEPITSCCVCCKEIPLDAAFTPEGTEYVEHFCGLDCYVRFQARAKAEAGSR